MTFKSSQTFRDGIICRDRLLRLLKRLCLVGFSSEPREKCADLERLCEARGRRTTDALITC